jgi:hypothetical protein
LPESRDIIYPPEPWATLPQQIWAQKQQQQLQQQQQLRKQPKRRVHQQQQQKLQQCPKQQLRPHITWPQRQRCQQQQIPEQQQKQQQQCGVRTAAEKDVVAAAGSTGAVPSLSRLPQRTRLCPQPDELPGCQGGVREEQLCAIPQFRQRHLCVLGLSVAAVFAAALIAATTQ